MTNADCQKVTIKHRPPFYIFKRHKKPHKKLFVALWHFLYTAETGGEAIFLDGISREEERVWGIGAAVSRLSFAMHCMHCFSISDYWDAGNFHLFRPHRLSCITTCNGTIGCPIPKYSQSLGPFLVSSAILEYNPYSREQWNSAKAKLFRFGANSKQGSKKSTSHSSSNIK